MSERANASDGWFKHGLTGRIRFTSELTFVVGVTLLWLVLYNVRFWEEATAAMWRPGVDGFLFMGSLFVLALFAQGLLLLFLPRSLLRPATCVFFLIAALVAYFSDTYGVFMDKDMLRNVLATDPAEVSGLISARLLAYVAVLGLIPCVLILRADLPRTGWRQRLKERSIYFSILLAICLMSLFALSAAYASFFREHKPVRFLLNPASGVYNLVGLLARNSSAGEQPVFTEVGGLVTRVATPAQKPLLLFLVIGETARAANFELGGYERATNPQLRQFDDLIYFRNTASCGTATEISLPCLFSDAGRSDFDVDAAKHRSNLLDMLASAGLDVEWRDNNSGCKGVCARIKTIEYAGGSGSPLCANAYCYDESMVSGLAGALRGLQRDSVIVFHQIGSHGPSYSQRYPPGFAKFKPACQSSQLDRCSREEVINAYDNTILYTDHNLAQQIRLLQGASDQVDSLLIYVSDHGESLGEKGVYLHGMPYALAPAYQKHVPFMIWMSGGYERRAHIDTNCLRARANEALSHDNVFHTVMGAVGVRNDVYRSELDLFARCRGVR